MTAEARNAAESLEPWCDLAAASRIQAALELVERSPDRRVTVPEVAKACHMARSSFDRFFRQVTGFSFAQFAMRRRLALSATTPPNGVFAPR